MKIEPLRNKQETYNVEEIAGAIRWLRLEIDNLYRKFNKGDVWRWSNDEVCDKCEEYVLRKIDEAFKDVQILGEDE